MNQGNKFCQNCGNQLKDGDKFCQNCGTAINNQQTDNNQEENNNYQSMNTNMTNNYNNPFQNNVTNNTSNNSNIKYVIIGVVATLVVGLVVYFATKKDNGSVINPSSNTSNNNYSSSTNPTIKVYFKGYYFDVPVGYVYKTEGETLSFGNSSDTWYAGVRISNGDFNKLITNRDKVISSIEGDNYKVYTYEQKVYSGMPCITMEVYSSGHRMLMAYAKYNSSTVFIVSLINLNKDYDYSLFSDIMKVLSTAK